MVFSIVLDLIFVQKGQILCDAVFNFLSYRMKLVLLQVKSYQKANGRNVLRRSVNSRGVLPPLT